MNNMRVLNNLIMESLESISRNHISVILMLSDGHISAIGVLLWYYSRHEPKASLYHSSITLLFRAASEII